MLHIPGVRRRQKGRATKITERRRETREVQTILKALRLSESRDLPMNDRTK
jgi:hypothetical protein